MKAFLLYSNLPVAGIAGCFVLGTYALLGLPLRLPDGLLELFELATVDIAGDHPPLVGQRRRQGEGLAAGAGAGVDQGAARRRGHQLGDELAALVLGLEQAALEVAGAIHRRADFIGSAK